MIVLIRAHYVQFFFAVHMAEHLEEDGEVVDICRSSKRLRVSE